MKQTVLVALTLILGMLLGCSPKASVTPPPTQQTTPAVTETPVSAPKALVPASFSLAGLTITPKEATIGSSVTIDVLVTNIGELSSFYDVMLKIDDTIEATEKVTLEGGASQKVIFRVTKFTAKTYSVNIDGQSSTLVVKSPPPSPIVQPPSLPPVDAFQKGFNFQDMLPYNTTQVGLYKPEPTQQQLKELAAIGTNWVAVQIRAGQETLKSTDIFMKQPLTATDEEIRRVVDYSHALGMRVRLSPTVIIWPPNPQQNHTMIGSAFTTEEQWQAWWTSYRQFIVHYAVLAQESGADMLLVGNEMTSTVQRESDWRKIVDAVRQAYTGPIFYEAVTFADPSVSEELRVKWWDAVDYIGVLGYLPLTNTNSPTVEELKAAWVDRGYVPRWEDLSKRFQKQILISEISYPSVDGINIDPLNGSLVNRARTNPELQDTQEQADCYQAAMEVFWEKPWAAGIYWFLWWADWTTAGPSAELGAPRGKPALEVVKKFYLAR